MIFKALTSTLISTLISLAASAEDKSILVCHQDRSDLILFLTNKESTPALSSYSLKYYANDNFSTTLSVGLLNKNDSDREVTVKSEVQKFWFHLLEQKGGIKVEFSSQGPSDEDGYAPTLVTIDLKSDSTVHPLNSKSGQSSCQTIFRDIQKIKDISHA